VIGGVWGRVGLHATLSLSMRLAARTVLAGRLLGSLCWVATRAPVPAANVESS
jgi:hypothetical protein